MELAPVSHKVFTTRQPSAAYVFSFASNFWEAVSLSQPPRSVTTLYVPHTEGSVPLGEDGSATADSRPAGRVSVH
jgi:hypothetical protein